MAPSVSFTASELSDKTGFTITDTGNWGAPNPLKTQILSDDLEIYLPNSDFTVGTGTPIDVDLLALGFPITPTVTIEYIADMGQTGTMPDGAYRMVRTTVVDEPSGEVEYTYEWTAIFRRIAQCCYDSYIASFEPCSCDGSDTKIITIARWNTDLQAVALAETCQDIDAGVTALDDATDICNREGCGGCGC